MYFYWTDRVLSLLLFQNILLLLRSYYLGLPADSTVMNVEVYNTKFASQIFF
jgi:hypothetical protein